MRLTVKFEPNADANYPCCAITEYQGKCYHGLGKTWEEAEKHLVEKITAMVQVTIPAPKTVDIPNDEMDTEFLPFEEKNGRVIEAGKL